MPSRDTFSIPPIANFVERWIAGRKYTIDPFARNSNYASFSNDLNPDTTATHHMDARDFLAMLIQAHVRAGLVILDMPYSPRQISDCYRAMGKSVGQIDTQNASLYKEVRDAVDRLLGPGGIVLSFGWSSVGMGKGRGYNIKEILLVCHGGAHNDTICMAESKADIPDAAPLFAETK